MATARLTCLALFTSSFLLHIIEANESFSNEKPTISDTNFVENQEPTVMIAVLVRNKAHCLPWFFGQLERLDYPKKRMHIWLRSDHNIDNSADMLETWKRAIESQYHSVNLTVDTASGSSYDDAESPCDWSDKRFSHVINLRQEALDVARHIWADYLLMLDADIILEHPKTLQILMKENKTVIGPMLNASIGSTYTNFWGGMNEEGYYERVPSYFPIVDRAELGTFAVPMVHTAVLINLNHRISQSLTYTPPENYAWPIDDLIIFAYSVKEAGITMHVVNSEFFGVVPLPLESHNTLDQEKEQFVYIKLEAKDRDFIDDADSGPKRFPEKRKAFVKSPYIQVTDPPADKMDFDEIFMINLLRRPERRKRMLDSLRDLGIKVKVLDAVDGKKLNDSYLKSMKIQMMNGYSDPYAGRPLTMGEIGCFLSHYFIWKEVIDNGYSSVLVFEDDVRFEPYFKTKISHLMMEVQKQQPDWDLIYLGRKRLKSSEEKFVDGASMLVWPSYSYWTLSYILSRRGAKKLMDQEPLSKLIPVDEYLPIMFDKHPREDWKQEFSPRNLVGLSVQPLLVYPTHYTGEPSYFSDTEDSVVIPVTDEAEESHKDEL